MPQDKWVRDQHGHIALAAPVELEVRVNAPLALLRLQLLPIEELASPDATLTVQFGLDRSRIQDWIDRLQQADRVLAERERDTRQ